MWGAKRVYNGRYTFPLLSLGFKGIGRRRQAKRPGYARVTIC